jgi:uncharacterized protein YbaP (TraB family)
MIEELLKSLLLHKSFYCLIEFFAESFEQNTITISSLMFFLRACTISFCLLLCTFFAKAQQKYPATFLWKITGNGLSKPSYLYGTIHLRDKSLFTLGDSVYSAIEKTEGLAIELNPAVLVDSIFSKIDNRYQEPDEEKGTVVTTTTDYKISKKLARKIKKFNRQRKKQAEASDDMPTILDLYLYKIASDMGKTTGGIEDVSDQFTTMDEIGRIKADTTHRKEMKFSYSESTGELKKIYRERNLSLLDSMINGGYMKDFKDVVLTKRNFKMAARMDSIAQLRSNFFAVGAAHLPGDSGVISLLRAKGYELTPVFSANYIPPGDFKYTATEKEWQAISDDNAICTVEMPGAPFQMTSKSEMPLKMYMDLTELSYYGFDVSVITKNETGLDSIAARIARNYKKTGVEIIDQKEIIFKDAKGLEITAKDFRGNAFRMRILVKENAMATLIFGSQTKEDIKSAHAEKFFNSLVFNNPEIKSLSGWKTYTDTAKAFSVIMPSVPRKTINRETNMQQYAASDLTNGSYYMVNTIESPPGNYFQIDSTYYNNFRKNLEQGGKLTEFEADSLNGNAAYRYTFLKEESGVNMIMHGYIIPRGNRIYLPLVAAVVKEGDDPEMKAFFKALKLLPYIKAPWSEKDIEKELTVWVPGNIEDVTPDSTTYRYEKDVRLYRSTDKNSVTTYNIEVTKNSPWFWSNNDSAYFKQRSKAFTGGVDSLISYSYSASPVQKSETVVKISGTPMYKKMTLLLNGDKQYKLYSYLAEDMLNDKNTGRFFAQPGLSSSVPSTLFENKMGFLLQSLKSTDSTARAGAIDAMGDMVFEKKDLPDLYRAMLEKYEENENNYRTVNEIIAASIAEVNDSSVIDFVNTNYKLYRTDSSDLPLQMLGLLAKNHTAKAMQSLKELLLDAPPLFGNEYNLAYPLIDSLQLTRVLFPAATALYGDTIIGPLMIMLANRLADSSMIKIEDILRNEKAVLVLAESQLAAVKKDKEAYPDYNSDVIGLLGKFNTPESNKLLYKFLELPDLYTKSNVIIALLGNGSAVPPLQIKKIAADNSMRADFYERLQQINKAAFFSSEYLSQKKFAESYLYTLATDDYEEDVKEIKFVAQKEGMLKDTLYHFFIFKIKTAGAEKNEWHLAICGAFSTDDKKPGITGNNYDSQLFTDEVYDEKSIDEKFRQYLEGLNKN